MVKAKLEKVESKDRIVAEVRGRKYIKKKLLAFPVLSSYVLVKTFDWQYCV